MTPNEYCDVAWEHPELHLPRWEKLHLFDRKRIRRMSRQRLIVCRAWAVLNSHPSQHRTVETRIKPESVDSHMPLPLP